MLVRLELDPARNHLLTAFFETYLALSDKEERMLQTEINNLDPEEEAKVMELMTSYERKGMEKGRREGIEKGRQEGVVKGKQEAVSMVLETKFGAAAAREMEKVRSIHDLQLLNDLLKQILTVGSLEDARKIMNEMTGK